MPIPRVVMQRSTPYLLLCLFAVCFAAMPGEASSRLYALEPDLFRRLRIGWLGGLEHPESQRLRSRLLDRTHSGWRFTGHFESGARHDERRRGTLRPGRSSPGSGGDATRHPAGELPRYRDRPDRARRWIEELRSLRDVRRRRPAPVHRARHHPDGRSGDPHRRPPPPRRQSAHRDSARRHLPE